MIDRLLAPLAPHICCGCGKTGSNLCDNCKYDIELEDFGRCLWCLRLTAVSHVCPTCKRKIGIEGAWVVGERRDVLKTLVDDYKFESKREAARELAELLDTTVPLLPAGTIISWVPTAPAHIRQRGFDHAAYLAKRFAARRQLRAVPLLGRVGAVTQHELSKRERERLASTAFQPLVTEINKPVMLIDDIFTTGASMNACVGHVRQVGAPAVYVAVVCRQPKDK